jgi:hypothetical protein
MSSGVRYFEIICAFCGLKGTHTCLSCRILPSERSYHVTHCCGTLLCYTCKTSSGKCIACSSETFGITKIKTDWDTEFKKHKNWNILCLLFRYMLPFTGSRQFGTWRDIIDIGCRMYEHPRYRELFRCYNKFADDFYSSQMLFYTLRSAPVRKLRLIALQPSPAMSEFLKDVASMAKFSRFSRKTVLNRYQFGFITVLFKRMIGEATPIQAYFLRKLLRYCLAKKASQKLPF